jgi:quercetin dioxygenase-like cupin family protein
MTADVIVTQEEIASRTVLRKDLKADRAAFLDTRIPGSERKINYPLIGPGVSENAEQVVPVTQPHGFNLGAAVMPAGVVNNLHLHFTAEVFMCFGGEWQFRWGVDGKDGEAIVADGDVISIPTWIFRGFTSLTDDAWLYTALGRDVSGGLIWAPSVIAEAARHGSHLSVENTLVITEPGEVPAGVELRRPLRPDQLDTLRRVSTDEMRQRLARPDDLTWSERPFLDSTLPGGGAQLATVVGYGITEDRFQVPRLSDPHGLTLAWLRCAPGTGVGRHRTSESEVIIVKEGRLRVAVNDADHEIAVELGPFDTLSVPPGAWREFRSAADTTALAAVITSGESRVYLEWDPEVTQAARAAGYALDPNGYVAPADMLND